jgi:hypothetical protein
MLPLLYEEGQNCWCRFMLPVGYILCLNTGVKYPYLGDGTFILLYNSLREIFVTKL